MTVLGSVLFEVRTADVVQRFGAPVTIVQILLVGFVAVAFTDSSSSACFLLTVSASVVGRVSWV
jgi:hypothetical protein